MEVLLLSISLYWGIPIAVFYALFGQFSRSYRKKVKNAGKLLQEEDKTYTEFQSIAKASLSKARLLFWSISVPLIAIVSSFFHSYAISIEPTAEFYQDGLGIFGLGIWLPPLVVCTIFASTVVSRWRQAVALKIFINGKADTNPSAAVLEARIELLNYDWRANTVVSILSAAAIVSSAVVGIAWLTIFYLAAEQAISCARTSKGC